MSYVLALDQSTSGTKALLFDDRGGLIDKSALPHQQHYPQAGWVEHDAEEIYQNVLATLKSLLARHTDKHAAIQGLSLTNQRETFVIFERETGKPLYNAIVWMCRRGEPICAELREEGHDERVNAITGLKIDTYFPASKITWLLRERPEFVEMLADGRALLGTIDAYLIYRLTGGAVFATDHTNACRTLLYNIRGLRWSQELCDLFGVPIQALPQTRESSANFGETTLAGHLGHAIPIRGVMGDSQAALFAEGCFNLGDAKVTFGSGSSVLLNIGSEAIHSAGGVVTTIGWVYAGVPTYAFEGIINYTGATINWMRDQMGYIDDPAETQILAESIPHTNGVYLVPAFVGLSAPYWAPEAQAAILGLTPASTRAQIVRAALESIAYQVRDVLEAMQAEAGIRLNVLHGDGGIVNNAFLMQFTADMTGVTLRASALAELSALGAVMMGYLGLGLQPDLAALSALPHAATDYTPNMDETTRETLYTGWLNAVQRVL